MMQEHRRVAVTGASGFVGSRLVLSLRQRGWDVTRLVRKRSAAKTSDLQPGELLWDPSSGLEHPEQLNGFDAVVHLAGRSIAAARWTALEKNRIYDSRVLSTKQLVKQLAALEQRPPVFVGASAVGFYGDCGSDVVDESRPAGDSFLADVAKHWEAAAQPLAEMNVRVAHARLAMVLDPAESALAKMLPLFRWGVGGRLGGGDQYWSWVAIDDVVNGLGWLVENPQASGAYNLCSPKPVTNAQFTTALANAVGRPAIFPAPKFALRLAMGEMADALLLTSCRAVPRRLEEAGFVMRYQELTDYFAEKL